MRAFTWCLLFALVFACGKSKPVDKVDPTDQSQSQFAKYQSRLLGEFLTDGFVISKEQNGSPTDQGDSLLFTGLTLGVLDCEKTGFLLAPIERMQDNFSGYLVRIDPLPEEYRLNGNTISRDGATGALYGLQLAKRRCTALTDRIDHILARWKDAVGNSLVLYPRSLAGIITPSFRTYWKVAHGIGISDIEYEEYIVAGLTTIAFIKSQKSACYPIHLQTIQHLTFEIMGKPIFKRNKDEFCALTKGLGLMLTDWYCGRNGDDLKSWLSNPDQSKHVYMSQRCTWENGDADDKLSPRVDFLVLFRHIEEGSSPLWHHKSESTTANE
jgi:hypothetical protein